MKIAIVVPREDNLASAGVRIRYQRLKPRLQALGHTFELVPIDSFRAQSDYTFDTYVFCKCHDARSLVLADAMARSGKRVGIDIFDDYYSQNRDSRFVHLREWLRKMAPSLTFAVCSTERMRTSISSILPKLPFHIINDPFDELNQEHIASTVERNIERALSTRQLDIGWFGMGDNPHFPVGLSDLVAFGKILSRVRRTGFEPRLSVLTNQRAMTVDRLEMLARLETPYVLEEWTEDLEHQLITNSTFCFLPVNAQPFSVVKSLNRAVTTLVGGAQVLSTGYPLYAELEPFIYRDLSRLISDVERGEPVLRRSTLSNLRERLDMLGNPETEAFNLVSFLERLSAPIVQHAPRGEIRAIVHGVGALSIVHKFAQGLGFLSVASPLSSSDFDYDVRIHADSNTGSFYAVLSSAAYQLLSDAAKQEAQPHHSNGRAGFYQLQLSAALRQELRDLLPDESIRSSALSLSTYKPVIEGTLAALQSLFGDVRVQLSEARSPYWPQTLQVSHRRDMACLSDTDAA